MVPRRTGSSGPGLTLFRARMRLLRACFTASRALLVHSGEDFGERYSQSRIFCTKDSVLGLVDAVLGMDPGATGARVDHPYVLYTEAEVIIDSFLHPLQAVF